MSRREFGVERGSCTCDDCVALCEEMPGSLIPDDLERIARAIAPRQLEDVLLASPGAIVEDSRTGTMFRIPTLVPARRRGRCVFLGADNRCTIHAVSPFSCAFFDPHHDGTAVNDLVMSGLRAVARDHDAAGPYARLHHRLVAMGRTARAPEVGRAALQNRPPGRKG